MIYLIDVLLDYLIIIFILQGIRTLFKMPPRIIFKTGGLK